MWATSDGRRTGPRPCPLTDSLASCAGADRSKLFLTSKLHPRDLGESATLAAFPRSLERLHTTYLDSFMLHYPRCFGDLCHGKVEADGDWRGSWRALEALYERGVVRAIGVCNFGADELRELLVFARVRPHLVQSWMDPLQQARPLRAVCDEADITFQAYSSLGTQHRTPVNPVLRHPTIARIAAAVGHSTAQVALRWALQRGAAVIPRSTRRAHMQANLALWDFELSPEQMAEIDRLDGSDPRVAVPPAPPKLCADEHEECERWAAAGECDNNPGFMHTGCAGSCGTCGAAPQHVEL